MKSADRVQCSVCLSLSNVCGVTIDVQLIVPEFESDVQCASMIKFQVFVDNCIVGLVLSLSSREWNTMANCGLVAVLDELWCI